MNAKHTLAKLESEHNTLLAQLAQLNSHPVIGGGLYNPSYAAKSATLHCKATETYAQILRIKNLNVIVRFFIA